jgi:hypothetical protein
MRFRKLRIAWSVGWGVVAVLLCVLWVRSYSLVDWVTGCPVSDNGIVEIDSMPGILGCQLSAKSESPSSWTHEVLDGDDWWTSVGENGEPPYTSRIFGEFGLSNRGGAVPYWFAVSLCAAFSAALWLRFRFSLRTLFIVTTLIAVVLGFVVYALK